MNCLQALRRPVVSLVTLAFLILIMAMPAGAQGDLTIPQAALKLWPEYDDPGVLVIFSGDFASTATFPQKVAFPIAPGARNIQATANDPTRGLLSQQWQIEGNKLAYTLPLPGFHIEYYVDRLPSGNKREIVQTFEAPYPIESLEITVQQPARATDFVVTPQASSSYTGTDGLTYHVINMENLAAGDKREIKISYVKPDSSPSSPQLAVTNAKAASQPVDAQPKPTTFSSWLPYLLIGFGLVALVTSGAYWFLSQRRATSPRKPTPSRQPQAPAQPATRPASDSTGVFCTQCGRPFRTEERFCAQCGAPRRG